MTGEKGKKRFSMEQIIVGTIVLSLAVFWVAVSILGITNLSTALQKEYTNSTYHMVDTAVTLVNGDHIDAYLQGEERGEFEWTQDALDKYCEKMYLSLVYVIKVDESDYGRFVSVFNSVNNEVGNTSYEAWELGHPRETTNEEYQQKYRALYEKTSTHETIYRLRPDDGSKPHITTLVPVSGSDGKVTALLCLQRPFREQVETRRPYLITISNRAKMGGTPGEILTFVNDSICEHNHAEMFVTVWLGILEISTGKVIEANAGHEYPAIYRKGGIFEAHKTKHGIVIGAMEGVRYRDHEFRLEPGDKLFVYTDGVPEATDRDLRMFTLDRLLSTLNVYRDGSPKEILNGVQWSIGEFVNDADQFDDMTMLCLEIKEKK